MGKANTAKLPSDVTCFLEGVENSTRRADSMILVDMMQKVTRQSPTMWGDSIVGFDAYHYKYASGREGDSFITGFSPRKQSLVVYITDGFSEYQNLLEKLGKHRKTVSCLYINKLDDVDVSLLEKLIKRSYLAMKKRYPVAPEL